MSPVTDRCKELLSQPTTVDIRHFTLQSKTKQHTFMSMTRFLTSQLTNIWVFNCNLLHKDQSELNLVSLSHDFYSNIKLPETSHKQ